MCIPREKGGLGLRKAKDFNEALLAKLAWLMTTNSDKLWVRAMREKYVKNGDFLSVPVPTHASWSWKSIIKGRHIVKETASWRVGNGNDINLWFDKWVGDNSLALNHCITIPDGLEELKVRDFILSDRSWDIVKLQDICSENMINIIKTIPIPVVDGVEDALHWPIGKGGKFSVSSAFDAIAGRDDTRGDWSWLWKVRVWEKVKLFLWLVAKGRIMTNLERVRRHFTVDNRCPVCGEDEESIRHMVWDCRLARGVWRLTYSPAHFAFPLFVSTGDWVKDNCCNRMEMNGGCLGPLPLRSRSGTFGKKGTRWLLRGCLVIT